MTQIFKTLAGRRRHVASCTKGKGFSWGTRSALLAKRRNDLLGCPLWMSTQKEPA